MSLAAIVNIALLTLLLSKLPLLLCKGRQFSIYTIVVIAEIAPIVRRFVRFPLWLQRSAASMALRYQNGEGLFCVDYLNSQAEIKNRGCGCPGC